MAFATADGGKRNKIHAAAATFASLLELFGGSIRCGNADTGHLVREHRADRDPGVSVEPDPVVREQNWPAFVLHEHWQPQHHFDLRLEENGVLRSWAVPRGLPEESGRNRLAVQVADHDLDHLTYADETKTIADIGWWEEHDRTERRLLFTLHGRGPARRYALIRTTRAGTRQNWLLHQTLEQPA